MKRLISRSGSTFAQVLRISLLVELSFVVVESNSLAQNAKSTAENKQVPAPLSAASLSNKSSSTATDSAITPVEANAISQMLLASLEAKLQQWQAMADSSQQAVRTDSSGAATPDSAFISQKMAALDRMIKLLEHQQTMRAVVGIYQKRLDEMQSKIQERGSNASNLKLE